MPVLMPNTLLETLQGDTVEMMAERRTLQKALVDESQLLWEALTYPIKNGVWVDPLYSGGLYQVRLLGLVNQNDKGIFPIDDPRTVWGDVADRLNELEFVDEHTGYLTDKGLTVLFHSCYRPFTFHCGEWTITIETTYLIGGRD